MTSKSISTKELREQLPHIRRELARGQQYTVIYRSKPIAQLQPIQPGANEPAKVPGGNLRLQANTSRKLTPEYLNKVAAQKYE